MKARVDPKNREQFEKTAYKWHLMIKALGWGMLSELRANRIEPFSQESKLKGTFRRRKKQARKILMRQMGAELRAAGLELTQ